jgi:hypothetical protein
MKKESKLMFILIIITISVFFAAGCSTFRHKYIMRGQILESSNGEVYLCIGTEDGASVGQRGDVYKFEREKSPPLGDKSGLVFVKEKTGTVKITEVIDHYAKAVVISGTAKENSIVELEK